MLFEKIKVIVMMNCVYLFQLNILYLRPVK